MTDTVEQYIARHIQLADPLQQIIARQIQLADRIIKEAEFACLFKEECADIKSKTEKLVDHLRLVAHASKDRYERPIRRVLEFSEPVLNKALQLIFKCQANRLQRLFTFISFEAIRKSIRDINDSIMDMAWLLHILNPNIGLHGSPAIGSNQPLLCVVWEQITYLSCSTLEYRADAAHTIHELASNNENELFGRMIIEEGGVPYLLKLTKEGNMEAQEDAVQALLLLGELMT